ncbi:pseudaminic acid synthase [Chitinophaga niabensis]|uniref:N-acetylneuraminate synthase n=1 Tax=Chitinophaga niabensis TaxID=536979 RepID=A0A1N6JXJ9_9BACT|nr:pseudaminic acid synthase [Chitinophaga niabensis]SIO49105.1 N-acetylneuraminate synthase [Chitinophaga niabensis]
MDIKIGPITIGKEHKPFIIAEMSGNHNQSLDRALAIVDAAADAGAHAIKLQTYTADTMTIRGAHTIKDGDSLWNSRELYDLYKEAYTPWDWHPVIFEHAAKRGLLAFSSPFDHTAVDFLESLNVPCYKIASFENTDHLLLEKVAKTGKPVIMSTGVATIADIQEAVSILRENGCKELVLLKCTSTYPATPENTNILTIPHMRELYRTHVGLSDHTMGIGVSIASVALGACVIEKHFTIRRADGGVDSAFSIEPHELASLVEESERAWKSLGRVSYELSEKEKKNMVFKRSLYIVKDIAEGETITAEHVRSVRPSNGLHTRFYKNIIGAKAASGIKSGTPLSWELIKQ